MKDLLIEQLIEHQKSIDDTAALLETHKLIQELLFVSIVTIKLREVVTVEQCFRRHQLIEENQSMAPLRSSNSTPSPFSIAFLKAKKKQAKDNRASHMYLYLRENDPNNQLQQIVPERVDNCARRLNRIHKYLKVVSMQV